jgi:hypothetical protein
LTEDRHAATCFLVYVDVSSKWIDNKDQDLWIEFVIRDLDGRPLTYWHQDLNLSEVGEVKIMVRFNNLYLNKSAYSASCAVWNSKRTHIYDSKSNDFVSIHVDPLNIGDFRVPATVSFVN